MSPCFTRTFRRAIAAALALAAMPALAPPADAAGTSLVDRDVLPNVGSGRLSLVVDAPNGGLQNSVRVTRSGDRYVVTDNADGVRARVASGCTEHLAGDPVTAARVECPVRDLVALGVFLRDGDDTVHNATDLPSFMIAHSGNDQALGGSARDRILGDTGNDVLAGEGGGDSIDGGPDDDVVDGGAGDDELDGGAGTDVLLGGAGADLLMNSPGPDDFRGGQDGTGSRAAEPVDVVAYTAGTVTDDPPVRVTLDNISNDGAAGEFDNVRDDVEQVVGANGPDHLIGNELANVFDGDDAGDLLEGAGGADLLDGGPGPDELHGGEGPDTLRGGGDADVVLGEGGDDRIEGGPGADLLDGGAGNDTILARDGVADTVTCGPGVDTVDADPVDVLAADCEPAAAPASPAPPPVPAPAGGETPQAVGGGTVLPGTGAVVAAPRSCPAVRVSSRTARLSRRGVLRVRLTATRRGAPCAAKVTVGRRVASLRLAPGARGSVRFRLGWALRARVFAGGRSAVRVTVRVRTVDEAGRVATARQRVRLVAR